MGDLSMNHIIPVSNPLPEPSGKECRGMINIFGGEEGKKLTARNVKIIREIAERTQTIETGVEALVNARKVANRIESEDARRQWLITTPWRLRWRKSVIRSTNSSFS